nr:probable glycosyltransferase At5g03795 [Tanacetum cinerariifolium]
MGDALQHILESKRFVWFVAIIFSVVIMLQYFEFPYGNLASSLFIPGRAQPPEIATFPPQGRPTSQIPKPLSNITRSDSSNHTKLVIDRIFGVAGDEIQTKDNATLAAKNATVQLSNGDLDTNFVNGTTLQEKDLYDANVGKKFPSKGNMITISDMHAILLYNRATIRSKKPRWASMVDQELLDARLQIENTPINDNDHTLYPIYHDFSRFKRSYDLMEKTLKVCIYKEGEKPIFHQPQLKGIYACEGWFMKHMQESKHFATTNPREAHLFYIPFSSRTLEEKLFVPGSLQMGIRTAEIAKNKENNWKRDGAIF